MLYSILKTIIETTIVQYVCQQCQGKINENAIKIGNITDTQIHLDITCPHCQAHAQIHAEVANIQGQIFETHGNNSMIPKNENALKEQDITMIENNLKTSQTIEDLLK